MVSDATWQSLNTIHAVVYSSEHHGNSYQGLGFEPGWASYFASRSAALGAASAELVTALFYGFGPSLIAKHVPQVWQVAAPETVLAARRDVASRALKSFEEEASAIADSLLEALNGVTLAGAALAAAHAALPIPDSPQLRLWHAATVLREYRGDRHWAVLTAAGLNGASAQALSVATRRHTDKQRSFTGWTHAEWDQALNDLRTRGWVDDAGIASEAGMQARQQLEEATSRVAAAGLDNEAKARLITAEAQLASIAEAITEA